ncbi:dihydrodipicolinate synthase family protein [Gimesia aquarii]|uniref:4-hydroxy-tetrahydrodipicolinate synthase n=1 Tax=Gimesia aquarii TaxID=2527964 RepID=A0A517WXJ3_9PLAN|nr:dihydrodipicolinate synthase family protein [Gimesia aquarii]QDU09968.1 4-hydroxy-tetrahydrodipicolinate synthase [Gimesia aquarii]
MIQSVKMITALGTPLTAEEDLHVTGMEAQIHDQLAHGINGFLVGGTMGLMQLLSDETYRQLVEQSVQFTKGRAELLVGVGDTSFVRTRDRIRMVEDLSIDGVVVISPFFVQFGQEDLVDYYLSLADLSSKPLFLYDLPQTTGTKLEVETVLKLAEHPNIRGIKCSDHFVTIRPVIDSLSEQFRVIVAQPHLMDVLLRSGVSEHLDGVYILVPEWIKKMVAATEAEDWVTLSTVQRDLSGLLSFLQSFSAPLFSTVTALMNMRGIPGNFAPRPMRALTAHEQVLLTEEPHVQKIFAGKSISPVEA